MPDAFLDLYVELLYHWNRRIRLVGEPDPRLFRKSYLGEVMEALPGLESEPWKEMVDVGSGNGMVAVPVAAAFPGRRVVALEPNGKKATFLRQVARTLPLPNLIPVQDRMEGYVPGVPDEELLWAGRGVEIPAGAFLRALSAHPGSRLLLFTSPTATSQRIVREGGEILELLWERPASGEGRLLQMYRVRPICFT